MPLSVTPALLRAAKAGNKPAPLDAAALSRDAWLFPDPDASFVPGDLPPLRDACALLIARLAQAAPLLALRPAGRDGYGRSLVVSADAAVGSTLLTEPAAALVWRPGDARGDARALVSRVEGGCRVCAQAGYVAVLASALSPHADACACSGACVCPALNGASPVSPFTLLAPAIARNAFRARVDCVLTGCTEVTGLFPAAALANHACAPSACFSVALAPCPAGCASAVPTLTLKALVPLRAGDEVSIAYVDPGADRQDRHARLRSGYAFTCACSLCESELLGETATGGTRVSNG